MNKLCYKRYLLLRLSARANRVLRNAVELTSFKCPFARIKFHLKN